MNQKYKLVSEAIDLNEGFMDGIRKIGRKIIRPVHKYMYDAGVKHGKRLSAKGQSARDVADGFIKTQKNRNWTPFEKGTYYGARNPYKP